MWLKNCDQNMKCNFYSVKLNISVLAGGQIVALWINVTITITLYFI